MANAIELIKMDHRKVEQLYERYQAINGQAGQKRTIAENICHELEIHAKIEEAIFYPAFQAQMGQQSASLVQDALKEHNEMKRMISQLQTSGFTGSDCEKTMQQMMQGVQHHVREEEREMLPQAQRHLAAKLDMLGAQMEKRKLELMAMSSSPGQAGTGTVAQQMTNAGSETSGASSIEQSIEVNVPIRTAYNQWTQFEEFPRFMEGVDKVSQLDDTHLHWQATIGGTTKEWDAIITEQIPDNRIAWVNTTGARNAGVVTFHYLSDNKTKIMLQLDYEPEGIVENIGDMLGVVSARIRRDLNRFKEFIEQRGRETGAWRGEVEHPQH